MENKTLQSGLFPQKHDYRDYSLFKTKAKKLAGLPAFPDNYNTDVGLWNPSQNEGCDLFTPPVPSMPYGCTDYAQSDLLVDEDKQLYNPMDLENITHANANGGTDLRTSLKAVVKLHPKHPAFFNVQPDIPQGGYIDFFDAVRLAIVMGKLENRAVSVGTPWFPQFTNTQGGIIPKFTDWNTNGVGWHNWVVKGWKTIDGKVYLIGKPWIGTWYGDNGFCYMDRVTFNRLMSIPGTVAYTLDKLLPGEVGQRIDSSIKQLLVSFFTQLFSRLSV